MIMVSIQMLIEIKTKMIDLSLKNQMIRHSSLSFSNRGVNSILNRVTVALLQLLMLCDGIYLSNQNLLNQETISVKV